MDNKEKFPINQQHENDDEYTKIVNEKEEQENILTHGQGNLSADISEANYEFTVTQHFEEELSAVDLRIARPSKVVDATGKIVDFCETNKGYSDTAIFLNNVYMNDSVTTFSEAQTEISTKNLNYLSAGTDSYYSRCKNKDYGVGISDQQNSFQNSYTLKEKRINSQNHLNDEKHFILLVDQETQTQINETKEACIQTVNYDEKGSLPFMKRKHVSSLNHYCSVCQRFFYSKSSFDRHKRSHLGKRKGKLNQNFNECSRENLKIVESYSESQSGLSTSLQVAKFQCDICCKLFSSDSARDVHLKSFNLEEFPLTKCGECHVQFFTLGALKDHVKYAHKRNIYESKSYCCIFCNEIFECSFTFQLHLEDHLSG